MLGAAACVLLYLFLLNFPGLGLRSSTRGVIPVLALAAGTWLLTRRFLRADNRSWAELGLSAFDNRFRNLTLGFLAGSVLTVAWVAIVTVFTGATWHLNPTFSVTVLFASCAFNFFNNVGEELVYRGYAFARLLDRFGPYITVVSTSVLFALMHVQAGVPVVSVIAAVFTSGLIFAAIFARWRSLPLALGFHVATNIVQDASGLRLSAASVFAPAVPSSAGDAGTQILIGIALVNVIVAIAILTIRITADRLP